MEDSERIKEVEWAYGEMKRRGWGFTSTGNGFGDPSSLLTAVGPFDGVCVQVLAVDADAVDAVRRAIKKSDGTAANAT